MINIGYALSFSCITNIDGFDVLSTNESYFTPALFSGHDVNLYDPFPK